MRILITGVTGFIGYGLAKRLVEQGHSVFGLVRFTSQYKRIPENVIPVTGDLTDYHSLEKIVSLIKPEAVFHLGALTPVSESYHQPRAYAETNYIGTINLLEALRKHAFEQVRIIAVAGTTEMYDTKELISDNTPFMPESPYAVSKVAATYYAEYMWRTYMLPVVTVIPTNTYGRAHVRQRHFFIEKVITAMLCGAKEIKLGSPEPIRDWMFREDHVDAYIRIMESALDGKPIFGQRFYFGTGRGYTIRETFEKIKKMLKWQGRVYWGVYKRPNETFKIVVDPTKSIRVLGWKPKYDLESGLRRAIEEWREVLGL